MWKASLKDDRVGLTAGHQLINRWQCPERKNKVYALSHFHLSKHLGSNQFRPLIDFGSSANYYRVQGARTLQFLSRSTDY
jgi:hypothetical protein